jgi:hypothetical protein
MDNGKSMDASNSIDSSKSRVAINNKDVRHSKEAIKRDVENEGLKILNV